MFIMVHRIFPYDAKRAFQDTVDILLEMGVQASFKRDVLLIVVPISRLDRIIIRFGWGSIWKMAGLSPQYYNTDSSFASEYLSMSASKCGGKEIDTLSEICKIVNEVFEEYCKVRKENGLCS